MLRSLSAAAALMRSAARNSVARTVSRCSSRLEKASTSSITAARCCVTDRIRSSTSSRYFPVRRESDGVSHDWRRRRSWTEAASNGRSGPAGRQWTATSLAVGAIRSRSVASVACSAGGAR